MVGNKMEGSWLYKNEMGRSREMTRGITLDDFEVVCARRVVKRLNCLLVSTHTSEKNLAYGYIMIINHECGIKLSSSFMLVSPD